MGWFWSFWLLSNWANAAYKKCEKIKMFSFLFIFCRNIFWGKNFQFFLMKSNLFKKCIFFTRFAQCLPRCYDIWSIYHCTKWHFVNWPFIRITFCQLTIVPSAILSTYHCAKWHFVNWPFVHMTFCQLTIMPSGILSTDHSCIWHSVDLTFCQVTFC